MKTEKFHEIYRVSRLDTIPRRSELPRDRFSFLPSYRRHVVNRSFLRSGWADLEKYVSDQNRGVPMPYVQMPLNGDRIPLPPPGGDGVTLRRAIESRESRRAFLPEPLNAGELAWLIRCVAGVRRTMHRQGAGVITLRTVPSAGARHPLETLVAVLDVKGLDPGLYRYMPLEDSLVNTGMNPSREDVTGACLGQRFCGSASAVFIWTAVPYRTEWRYGPVSPKLIALDAGHACQNLYLAVEAVSAGTCAIGAYDQKLADAMCGLDGEDEFVIYMAPVGKVSAAES
jgi:SagB-type dehydrogenase family enzyme